MFQVKPIDVAILLTSIMLVACRPIPITQTPRGALPAAPSTEPTATPFAQATEPIAAQNMRVLLRNGWVRPVAMRA